MLAPLTDKPTFDEADFKAKTAEWKSLAAGPGFRTIIEWGTVGSFGPHVFVYPAGNRAKGLHVFQRRSHAAIDERWADFLEFEFIPLLVESLKGDGYPAEVTCVDLRPLQVQRDRRRAIEAAGKAKSGSAAAH